MNCVTFINIITREQSVKCAFSRTLTGDPEGRICFCGRQQRFRKTSMLNLICGSIGLDDGQILVDGKDITKQKEYKRLKRIGRVYQNPAMGTCPK